MIYRVANFLATLIVDLFETNSFAATASMNLSRCLLAAAGTSAVEPLIKAVGTGWAFSILALICIAATPLAWAEFKFGHGWRERRIRIT